jgi:hypothetical protein
VKIYCVWNMAYKPAYFFANDHEAAVTAAVESGHVRKRNFRKCADKTEEFLQDDPRGFHARALASGFTGGATWSDEAGWSSLPLKTLIG